MGFFSFVFSVSAFGDGFFDFTLGLLEFGLQFSFLVDKSGVLGVKKVGSFVGLVKFGFSEFSASFGLFNGVSEFFDFTGEQVGSSFNDGHLFTGIFSSSFSFIEFGDVVFQLALKNFDVLAGISSLSVGMSELDFQVVEVAFQLEQALPEGRLHP